MQLSQRPSRPGARGWACNEALHSTLMVVEDAGGLARHPTPPALSLLPITRCMRTLRRRRR
jgi:hypothetical protein